MSFWGRGSQGGERLAVKIADRKLEQLGDATVIGDLASFLHSGRVEPAWQQAVIRLDRLPSGLDRRVLASLVLEGLGPKHGEVYVSRLAFSRETDPLPSLPEPEATRGTEAMGPTATWIWNTGRCTA